MKVFKSILLAILISSPVVVFSQSKLGQLSNFIQDSSKPKSTGTQSNLAVSDEGKGGEKSQNSKTANDKPKDSKNNSPAGSSNLAVSDEGKGGVKGKSTSREATVTDTSKGKEIKKGETKTANPKQ